MDPACPRRVRELRGMCKWKVEVIKFGVGLFCPAFLVATY